MKKTALHKSIRREIFGSATRFLSILGIIALGVAFYVGIKATGPDMEHVASNYMSDYELMDMRVISTLGLTEKDQEALSSVKGIESSELAYSKDVVIAKTNSVMRVYSYTSKQTINRYSIIEGKMPDKENELAVDGALKTNGDYKIGDTITIDDEDGDTKLKAGDYKIVGFVNSPQYIETVSRGNSSVGSGSVSFFAVADESSFDMKAYTDLYIRFTSTEKMNAFSDEYSDEIATKEKQVKAALKNRATERRDELSEDAQKKIDDSKAQLADGEAQLNDAEKQLNDAETKLAEGEAQYNEGVATYQQQIASAETQLAEGQTQLDDAVNSVVTLQSVLDGAKGVLDISYDALEASRVALEDSQSSLSLLINSIDLMFEEPTITLPDIPGLSNQSVHHKTSINEPQIESMAFEENNTVIQSLAFNPSSQPQLDAIDTPTDIYNFFVDEYNAAVSEYENYVSEYNEGIDEINQGYADLATAQVALEQAKQEGLAKLEAAKVELDTGRAQFENGKVEFANQQEKLNEAKQKVADAEKQVKDIPKATYYYTDRTANPGFVEYQQNADRLSKIATVFPVFFFLIAALVCLTTMTRMVEEKRGEIGALKALGYSNFEISQKYIVYASTASLTGSLIGLAIGYTLFPTVIFNAYGVMYTLPKLIIQAYPSYTIESVLVSLLCTLGSALVVLRVDLFESPAILMRPKAPKAGQRILLERLPFIWNRLSFIQKVTMRNLFRYKQRMWMTILGIAGCMAMIVTGFGVRDSISDIVTLQFDKLWHYDAIVSFQSDASETTTDEYNELVKEQPGIESALPFVSKTFEYKKKGVNTQNVTVYVPEDMDELNQFTSFYDWKSGKEYTLSENETIISEKLARLYSLSTGDTITLTDGDNNTYDVKVGHIVENYVGHFIYMSPHYYEKTFGEKPVYNSELLKTNDKKQSEKELASTLMTNSKVINVSFLSETRSALDDTMNSLTVIVWVLIISAAILSLVVNYNLTNINISERIRELSTIKVLGFYDREVTMYVYRENIILTFIGIIFGYFMGKMLHAFVMGTVEMDMMTFPITIKPISYIISALLTLLFSFIVLLIMHRKLKRVNMIEALKSNE